MAFVRSPDGISIELLQKGESLAPKEPWPSMQNSGSWSRRGCPPRPSRRRLPRLPRVRLLPRDFPHAEDRSVSKHDVDPALSGAPTLHPPWHRDGLGLGAAQGTTVSRDR